MYSFLKTIVLCISLEIIGIGVLALVSGTSLLILVPALLILGLILACIQGFKYLLTRGERQNLVVSFPALPKMTREVSTLLIGRDDTEVILFLQKHGKTVRNGETITVKYHGKQIYFPILNGFHLNHQGYRPKTVHVDFVGGFDSLA
jgi:uncharacterized membrane protein